MLDARGDDVPAGALKGESHSPDCSVVRLRAAAREHDLAHPSAEHLPHRFTGVVDGLSSLLSKRVDARGFPKADPEVRQHRLQRLRSYRRRCSVVHIDHFRQSIHTLTDAHIVARKAPPYQSDPSRPVSPQNGQRTVQSSCPPESHTPKTPYTRSLYFLLAISSPR